MNEIITILLIILACFIAYKVIKHKLKNKIEVITAYSGGLGSGKTFLSVKTALYLYRKNLGKWKRLKLINSFKNLFRKNKLPFDHDKPLLLSNIPVLVSWKGHGKKKQNFYSTELTEEHLLLQERIPLGSVVMIDEVGSFANQFDYNQKNVIDVFDEFVRFLRHYVSNPKLGIQAYMVVNDQCSENINLVIRRRLNIVNNLSNFYLLFGHFCFWYQRQISISEEIKTIDMKQEEQEADRQDNMNFKFMLYFGGKRYDTYCYHDRYLNVPKGILKQFTCLKRNTLLKCHRDKDKLFIAMTENKKNKEVKK